MLQQLANILEQLDLALEHIRKGDVHNSRFGLMLTDNAIEIMAHQFAKGKAADVKQEEKWGFKPYPHSLQLRKATGQNFVDKIKFARLEMGFSEELTETICFCHLFRNDLYHIGLRHEYILNQLSRFYFWCACEFLKAYPITWWGFTFGQDLPERATKYLKVSLDFQPKQFQEACDQLAANADYTDAKFIETLATHMSLMVDEEDECLDFLSDDCPVEMSRDEAIIACQAWQLQSDPKAEAFITEHQMTFKSGCERRDWLEANYPFPVKKDPIPAWRRRAKSVEKEHNPHLALKKYRTWMDDTETIREQLSEAAIQLDTYINMEIDRMRGK